jgi:hypothetical protein
MASRYKPIIIKPARTIARSARPYHEEQGWRQNWWGSRLTGFYRSRMGSWEGEIQLGYSPRFYVLNPPPELRGHPHWVCFTPVGGGWFRVHFKTRPNDIDSGILSIERMINEAFYPYQRRA